MMGYGPIRMFLLPGVEEWLGQRNAVLVSKRIESMESSGLGNLSIKLILQIADLIGA